MAIFADYLKEVKEIYQTKNATEHTYRPALKNLIESLASGILATNEPKRVKCGSPDFIITQNQLEIGHIEAKDIGIPLNKIIKTPQIIRYLNGLGNLILTDYLEFRWYVAGEHRLTATIAKIDNNNNKLIINTEGIEEASQLFAQFLQVKVPQVTTPKELAKRMASLAQLIRDAIVAALVDEDKGGMLREQLESFQKVLIRDLTQVQFADMYAQTICYGLFAARCNTDNIENFSRETAGFRLPKTNPFLRSIFGQIAGADLDERITWAVDILATILQQTDMAEILKDFGKRTRKEDAVVHFYETFLAEYDPKMRESRGVYYTPEPVVSYIVKSVDFILKNKFKIAKGLADSKKIKLGEKEIHQVLILDPAVGTGTFMYNIIDHIYESFKHNKGMWSSYVSQHLLPRLFGFELLMAPYTVAHMKLGLQLQELGYDFHSDERLRIYLTNTLQEAFQLQEQIIGFGSRIKEEAEEAKNIKENQPVMVILGNPPYSGHSVNTGDWIKNLLNGKDIISNSATESYFQVDGKPLGEKNPKWLNDDYVKFIRFSQWRIEKTGYGILAFVTNHGYLDNPTFRGMRQSLMKTFDEIYVLDLHGNSKKKEVCNDGSKDQNVFDIQQGVAIGIFIKYKDSSQKLATVYHADLWGIREIYQNKQLVGGKYHWLAENDINSTEWEKLEPSKPFYLFKPQNVDLRVEYDSNVKITDIIPINSVGIVTARDNLTIHNIEKELWTILNDFVNLQPEEARINYNLGKDARDWKVEFAQKDIRNHPYADTQGKTGPFKDLISKIAYRPFDIKYTYYTGKSRGFHCMPRRDIMRHMKEKNLGFHICRQIVTNNWQHILVTSYITDDSYVSNRSRERGYTLPLYIYPETQAEKKMGMIRQPNLSSEFIIEFSQKLNLEFIADGKGNQQTTFAPEDIFNYIYAVFHSPNYRNRYAEFLKIDFPRVPLTSNPELFWQLVKNGDYLVQLHLMRETGAGGITYPLEGSNIVEKVSYDEINQRVYINSKQYFYPVFPHIWNFYIGGYQVCQKWLKDRKNRELNYEDLIHYQNIISILTATIKVMQDIDIIIENYGGFPIE